MGNVDKNEVQNSSSILDYADYVEMACEEESGTYRSYPSVRDVIRSGTRYIDPSDFPPDPLAVDRARHDRMFKSWTDYDLSRSQLFGEWHYLGECPYCNIKITRTEKPGDQQNPYIKSRILSLCRQCGWWESDENAWPDETTGRSVHRRAILREFSVAGSEAPIESLHQYVAKHPSALNEVSPRNLERLVGSVFGEFMNCETIHVGGANDDGIDLLLIDSERRYVVQVKRRMSPHAAEAVSGVREFLGAMLLDGTLRGLFVSTAPRFSHQARATASKAEQIELVEKIELIDSRRLVEVCRLTTPQIPPPSERAWSKPEDFADHLRSGFNKFSELAMGNSRWKMARGQ